MRPGWLLLLLVLGAPKPPAAAPPTFTEVFIGPADPVMVSELNLGDYDGDGDLDLGIQSIIASGARVARLYKFDAGAYTHDTSVSLVGVIEGPIVFEDVDRDGDLDLVVSGITDGGIVAQARYYRNDGVAGFTEAQVLQGMKGGEARWADFDNDGDLDLFLCGEGNFGTPNNRFARIYRNDNGVFHVVMDFGPLYLGEVAVGDYDRDGDIDFAITGNTIGTRIYRNDGNWHFTNLGLSFVAVDIAAAIEWADYDGDGDLDFIVTGEKFDMAGLFAEIYRNDGNDTFTAINAGLPPLRFGDLDWGDYDNDGDLDLLMVGSAADGTPITKIFRNDGGVFVDSGYVLAPGATVTCGAWADYDNDGDLDLFLGTTAGVRIFRNDSTVANTAPSAPSGLTSTGIGANRVFSWSAATDTETPSAALGYDLKVGTTSGGREIMGAPEGLPAAPGNVNGNLSWRLQLPPGTYYASVRTVDTGFKRSAWSAEHSFVVDPPVKVVSSSLVPPLLTVTFDRPPDPSTIDATTVRLTRNGVPVNLKSITLVGSVLTAKTKSLTKGTYELRVSGTPAPPGAFGGLYAHWPLDEGAGTSTADASGNGHGGTLVGAGWTSTGRFGAALTLNEGTTRVEVGNGVISPPWTVSLWVQRDDASGSEGTLIDSDGNLVPGSSLQLELNGFQDRTGIQVYGGPKTAFNRTVETGRWRHLVFQGTATGTSLYVDGRLQDQVATVMDLYPERIGGHRSLSMKGAIDEIQVYGRALNTTEIQTLATPVAFVRGTDTHILDGDGDGNEGGDFVGTFIVAPGGGGGGGCGLSGLELLPLLLLRRRTRNSRA